MFWDGTMKTELKAVKKLLSHQPQLRQDLTSGDWVLFSPKRGSRPYQFRSGEKTPRVPKSQCIFETPEKASGGKVIASYPNLEKWRMQVIPNKYPVVLDNDQKAKIRKNGPYNYIEGYGHHELVITKDHDTNLTKLPIADVDMLFNAFRERYRAIAEDKNTAYISIFQNWGPKTGASIYHPHYQILSTPILPPATDRSLSNSRKFHYKHKKCAHCDQIKMARKNRRVLYEDSLAMVFAPYAPKEPFEFRVSPKAHSPYFEDASGGEVHSVIKGLQTTLRKLERLSKNLNYNLYIHTTPVKNKKLYGFYHWHIQVVPREITPHLGVTGGFELTTGIEINSVLPEDSVKMLKDR